MTTSTSQGTCAGIGACATDSALPFPVVGIGASAGGLRALVSFLENAPTPMDMAFVVILHRSATDDSHADQILQRATAMHVCPIAGTTAIEKNHVYVLSQARHLLMLDGELYVEEIDAPNEACPVIDEFFRTLADAQMTRAVGLVLSGTGSDGALGLGRIKECGGIAIAQAPDDAQFPEMPRQAIVIGRADIVLPVAEIPRKLLDLWANAQQIHLPAADGPEFADEQPKPPRDGAEALREILTLLRLRTGHDFQHYKRATVLRRIERRLQVNALPDLEAYLVFLRNTPDETAALLADMLIGVTQFFRDREAFDALARTVVPDLFQPAEGDAHEVRVWIAGCSTGEEAYSIAILMAEARKAARSAQAMRIFATDIDEAAIVRARSGWYPGSIAGDVAPELLSGYFQRSGNGYMIARTVRERMLFATHSLLRDPPFSKLDLISCRNVLIYLERAAQRQVLELFHSALRPGSFLFLGTAESADVVDDLFSVVDKKNRIYRARKVVHRLRKSARLRSSLPTRPMPAERAWASAGQPALPEQRGFSSAALHQRVLEAYAPASVVVDRDSSILHLSEHAGRFLRYTGGEPSLNIVAVVLPELRYQLRVALFRARQSGLSVAGREVKTMRDGRSSWVNVIVRPFHDAGLNEEFFLVQFDEVQERIADECGTGREGEDPMLVHLESELQQSREQFATTVEQYQTSVEELRAFNEELQVVNDEFESSKEMLESSNEEMTTLNTELHAHLEETAKANDNLQNVIVSANIAAVFVDKNMQITQFTPRAADIFRLIDADIGRSLFDVAHSLKYPMLVDDVKRAIETAEPIQSVVESQDNHWYQTGLSPSRVAGDTALTLIDVTARHEAEERARIRDEGGQLRD